MTTDAPNRKPGPDPIMLEMAKLLRGRPEWQLKIVRGMVLAMLFPPKPAEPNGHSSN